MVIWEDEQGIHEYLVQIDLPITKNVAKYEASIFEVMNSRNMGTLDLVLFTNSRLAVDQYTDIFEAKDDKTRKYLESLNHEYSLLKNVRIEHFFCNDNSQANALATLASVQDKKHHMMVTIIMLLGLTHLRSKWS